jgi:hypothetical protein
MQSSASLQMRHAARSDRDAIGGKSPPLADYLVGQDRGDELRVDVRSREVWVVRAEVRQPEERLPALEQQFGGYAG